MFECSPAELILHFNTLSCESSSQTLNHNFKTHPVSTVVLDTEVVLENLNTTLLKTAERTNQTTEKYIEQEKT